MSVSIEDVRVTATMARLALEPEELQQLAQELTRILDYAAELQALDLGPVEATSHAIPLPCPLRDDEPVGPHLDTDLALRGAPAREQDFFAVPAILSGASDREDS